MFVYVLSDPREGNNTVYVGQTSDVSKRYEEHLDLERQRDRWIERGASPYYTSPKYDWIEELLNLGLKPVISEVYECSEDRTESSMLERYVMSVKIVEGYTVVSTEVRNPAKFIHYNWTKCLEFPAKYNLRNIFDLSATYRTYIKLKNPT